MTEPQWVFPDKRQPRAGRAFLVVLLTLLALAIVAALVYFFVLRPADSDPSPTPTETSSSQPTDTPSPEPSVSPSETPTTTPPPSPTSEPLSPEVIAFGQSVAPWLDDAQTGLGFLESASGTEADGIVANLREDAGRLLEQVTPDEIRSAWAVAVDRYARSLESLHNAIAAGSDTASALASAHAALDGVRGMVGQ